ncbi:type IV pilus secretin PilQ/competence protein [Mizugakiibacter sediminis]|uniref:Type IV pilus secretin PilQ/competence protein n=2 Tax=Mizugakiibacter sediminis TaxID=1475481 RepID=A0A0K8QNW8_9GAMM|nr:type IV pilus secretin PilQ [Mizugakiibacter sediminis]GAP66112.1 type IV pilus secretin PilQ/competence protein [Mizugakiibacter sediminis]
MMTKPAQFGGYAFRLFAGIRRVAAAALVLTCFGFAVPALAASVLKDLSYQALPGGKIQVTLKFDGGVPEPKVFTTENPPRIALDFAGTSNAWDKRHVDVGTGATAGISAVEAGGRTRVVVDLFRPSSYDTKVAGDALVLTVGNGMTGAAAANAVTETDPTKLVTAAAADVSNIDFRRGPSGEGRVIVSFSGPGASVDMRRQGDRVVVDLSNVKLPAKLARRLDVLDFATPVQSIETSARPNGARMEIAVRGDIEPAAYQTGTEYVVEIAPKKTEQKALGKGQEPVYTGSRVTFNFQDIPTRSVLQLLADVSGLNIVASDTVGGSVTLRLVNVPWDQALDVVLRAKGLDKRRNGNIIWVAPQQELARYEQDLAEARLKAEDNAELVSDIIPISYGKASDIAKLLTQGSLGGTGGGGARRGFLSTRGSVSFDERTNTLLINDTPDKIRSIRELVGTLDRPVQQVLIESRIVVASDDFTRELGVKFGVSGVQQQASNGHTIAIGGTGSGADNTATSGVGAAGSPAPGVFPHSGVPVGNLSDRLNVNLPAANPTGSFGLAILGANYLLDLELSAAQTEGRGEVISSPRVITANQQEAVIKQGQQIGYVTFQNSGAGGGSGAGTATVQFKDAVLELRVTPTITADDRVYLQINVKKDSLAQLVPNPGGGFVPQIDTREINTSVLVDNGQTVVLGGIYEITKSETLKKVPGLGDIPGLGVLFRNKNRTNNKAELLIFVTPKILAESLK